MPYSVAIGLTKNAANASHGSLPSIENSAKPTTSVAVAATSGDSHPAMREGWGRGSRSSIRRSGIEPEHARRRKASFGRSAASDERARHQHADLLRVGAGDGTRVGQPTLRDHRESIADLEQLVELFRNDEHRDAGIAQVEQ